MKDIVSEINDKLQSKPNSFSDVGKALTWIHQIDILLKKYINDEAIQYRLFRKYFGDNIEQIGIPVEIQDRLNQILDIVNPTVDYIIKNVEDKVFREGQIGEVKLNLEYPSIKFTIELVDSIDTILSKLDKTIDSTINCILPQYLKPGISIEQLIVELHQMIKLSSKSEDVVSYSRDICEFLSSNFNVSIIEAKDADDNNVNPDMFRFSSNPNIEKSIMTMPAIVGKENGKVLCKGRIVLSDKQCDNNL